MSRKRRMGCDCCRRVADTLIAVETMKATYWSPSENELWREACVQQAQARAEQDEEQRLRRAVQRLKARTGQ